MRVPETRVLPLDYSPIGGVGDGGRTRTDLVHNQALYQLSYAHH